MIIQQSGAIFSECRQFRYSLWRTWDVSKPVVTFVGLNPSTADAIDDDATIRRCLRFADSWGYGQLYMVNLFGLRATDPVALYGIEDPVGRDNDRHVKLHTRGDRLVVAVWGAHGGHRGRGAEVTKLLQAGGATVRCMGLTKKGHPKHPLYLRKDTILVPFPAEPQNG